jgi:hypothetical protein
VYVGLRISEVRFASAIVANVVPRVVIKTDDDASSVEHLLVVVAKGEECESFLVPVVVFVDTSYT